MFDENAVIAILVKKLDGQVTITRRDIDSLAGVILNTEADIEGNGITISVEHNAKRSKTVSIVGRGA